jgi:hypothetical protein
VGGLARQLQLLLLALTFRQVVCVYLFHELPEAVRRRAAAEFARVLRPGGLVVLADSVQLGDRPGLDKNATVFGDYNEPYYRYGKCLKS